jgi:hypothetical protein
MNRGAEFIHEAGCWRYKTLHGTPLHARHLINIPLIMSSLIIKSRGIVSFQLGNKISLKILNSRRNFSQIPLKRNDNQSF